MKAEAMMKSSYNCGGRQPQLVRTMDQLQYKKIVTEKEIQNPSDGLRLPVAFIENMVLLTKSAIS